MIIDALYNAGLITARVFAFSISSSYDSTSNFLDIGAYDTANMRDSSELIWFEAINDFWWTNYISGIKFGPGHNLDQAYKLTTHKAMTDTGSSCSYIPETHFDWII